jgi:hypothetical protein
MNVPILSNFHKHFESQTLFFWFKTSKTPPWLTDGPRQNYGRFLRSSTKHHVHGDVTLAAAEKNPVIRRERFGAIGVFIVPIKQGASWSYELSFPSTS